jgi:hypothetical protein
MKKIILTIFLILSCASTAMAMDFWDDLEEDTFPVLFELPGEEQCSICYANMNSDFEHLTTPRCGHIFHTYCIQEWAKQPGNGERCPLCRAPHGIEADISEIVEDEAPVLVVDERLRYILNEEGVCHLCIGMLTEEIVSEVLQEVIRDGKAEEILHLSLPSRYLTGLPEEVAQLPNLHQMSLTMNMIDRNTGAWVEGELACILLFLGRLNSLKILSLNHDKLEALPSEIGGLENLEQLTLHDNRLTELPEELALLQNLKYLDLGANPFEVLPEVVGEIPNLTVSVSDSAQISEALLDLERRGQLTIYR